MDVSTQHASRRIAIVGAGIAGLSAALALQDANIACDVYEASNRIGGRMHSDTTTWADGLVSELCGEFIDGDHETLLRLCERFKLTTLNLSEHRAEQSQRIMYFSNRYYHAEELAKGFEKITPILQQQVQEAGFPTTYNHYTEIGYRLDHMSVYDWIERYVEGGHMAPLGRMLDGGCRGFLGMETRLQSALNLLYMFGSPQDEEHEDQKSSPRSAGPLRGSYRIVGGNQRLPQAIAHSLPSGALHLQHELAIIKRQSDDTLLLTFSTPEGYEEVICDHVILALPFSTLRHVDYQQADFDTLKQMAIEQLGYGTNSKLTLQFDAPYWYKHGPWPHDNNGFIMTDLDIQVLWDTSLGQHGTHALLVDYTSGVTGASYQPRAPYTTTSDSEQVQHYAQQCLQELERVLPGISSHYTGVAALSYPTGDPYLCGSYSCWGVGQYTLFAGYESVRQGPIHFAGEHCSVRWQGFMEGGAREGMRAAQEIIRDYEYIV